MERKIEADDGKSPGREEKNVFSLFFLNFRIMKQPSISKPKERKKERKKDRKKERKKDKERLRERKRERKQRMKRTPRKIIINRLHKSLYRDSKQLF